MIKHRLITELAVLRPQTTPDGAGGQTVVLVQAETIRAQVTQPNVEERAVAQRLGSSLSHVVHTSYGADVRRNDELEGDVPSLAAARLRVFAVLSNSRATYLRLECEVVQAGG